MTVLSLLKRSLFALAFLGVVSAKHTSPKKTFTTGRRNHHSQTHLASQIAVRGGAGPLDPTVVAKTITVAGLASGTYATLAPEPYLKTYGIDASPMRTHLSRRFGVTVLAYCASCFSMLFKECSLNTAVAIGLSIWTTEFIQCILNDNAAKVGYNGQTDSVWLLLGLIMAYITFNNMDISSKAIKAYYTFVLVTSVPGVLNPSMGAKAYGAENLDEMSLGYLRLVFTWLIASCVFYVSVASGTDVTKAIGYASIIGVLDLAFDLFVNKKFDNLGVSKGPVYLWLVAHLVVAATCVLG